MSYDTVVRARIDKQTKEGAEAVLAQIGLTLSDAVRLMMIRIAREGAMPFNPLVPNDETIAALREGRAGKLETVGSGSIDGLLAEIDAHDPEDEKVSERSQARKRR